MLEFAVKILFIIMIYAAYLMVGIKIAKSFDELENDRYIYYWPVVVIWLIQIRLEDIDWFLTIDRIWWRIREPF